MATPKSPRSKIAGVAESIYYTHFGHIDAKGFHSSKVLEIVDWLEEGQVDPETADTTALAAEWAEYDEQDIADNAE